MPTHTIGSTPLFRISLIASLISYSFSVHSNEFSEPVLAPSQTDFGGVGLMQMPSGRMAPEGEFNLGGSFNSEYHHYTISLQLMPWFESTIRYTKVQDLLYSDDAGFSGNNEYTDKGIDFKIRLLEENYWLPETSFGVRDFGGTGLFDGEFIAATKRLSNLDFTLGIGWGYIGQSGNSSNPFCKVSDTYCSRQGDFKGSGGSVDFERWFKGPASIYGGIEYQTPFQPLRLKLEYDANDYSQDFPVTRGNVDMTQHSPWNVGALYRLGNWGDIKASYQRGDTFTLGLNLTTNFNQMKAIWRDETKPEYEPEPAQHTAYVDWDKVAQDLEKNAGYKETTVHTNNSEITVTGKQIKYRDRNEAHERAATVLANSAPSYIKQYRIIETNQGLETTETIIDANKFKQVANQEYINSRITDATSISEPQAPSGQEVANRQERWDYSVSPTLAQSFGSAENFYLYSIGLNTASNYWLTDNLEVSGSIYFNLADNYDEFNYIISSKGASTGTPRVRSLFRSYVHDNPIRMSHLQLTWFEQLSDEFYAQAYAGYLEMMFGGVGSEILYRPMDSNWALGLDMNIVKQRDPDSWFNFFEEDFQRSEEDGRIYQVLTQGVTGHLTGYYMPQWSFLESTLLKVSAGQFLGGDKGARFDFSKQFKSGVIAGAYASFTNLSAEEYGEGSYTKGFYISIPFDIMTVKPSANRAQINWQPLTRDGGQMLGKQNHLFEITDSRSPWYGRPNQVK